ncbi:MAG TPA: tetratricopeptide repeat protein [Pyrinomonadaceae bacterium]|nr:tetratricopeptide repeat protein [Pyrinomonadaceae bacterium]
MSDYRLARRSKFLSSLFLSVLILQCAAIAQSQTSQDVGALKQQASQLIDQSRYTEALPLLEKIIAAEPDNAQMHFYLGFALLAQTNITNGEAAERALRVRARNAFIKSKELGNKDVLVDALIQSLPADGGVTAGVSPNIEANRAMMEAEASFAQGKMDDALRLYQKALGLDPNIYEAALFSGDVFMHKEDYAQAEVWYQKAIKINPDRETAYRYSATPLMKQGKIDEARDRYIEAYISEPYSRFSVAGLSQWAQVTQTKLAHPDIDIPSDVTFDEKGDARINLSMGALLGGKDDGSFAWISYGGTRSEWHKEKFAKTFPNETIYRHSLAEETDALQSVLALATSDKKVKNLSPSLAKLKKLNDSGLLEAYILLAKPDRGIAQDFPAYRKANRAKLRQYVKEYILTGGGA